MANVNTISKIFALPKDAKINIHISAQIKIGAIEEKATIWMAIISSLEETSEKEIDALLICNAIELAKQGKSFEQIAKNLYNLK